MERQFNQNETLNSEHFWSSLEKSWPDITVVNKKDILSQDLNIIIVLCPLYKPGNLSSAGFIKSPDKIEDSRLVGKLKAYKEVLSVIPGYVNAFGGNFVLNVVFSDKGVLLRGVPTVEDKQALAYHYELYSDDLYFFAREHKINLQMSKYSDHNVDFPEFVDLNDPLPNLVKNNQIVNKYPNLESKMIADLNLYMGLNISYSKRNRHLIDRIINMDQVGSYSAAFWLIAGYLAFDPKIADIAGENGIYMVAERLEPLFGIARFTESLKNMTRVQIKA